MQSGRVLQRALSRVLLNLPDLLFELRLPVLKLCQEHRINVFDLIHCFVQQRSEALCMACALSRDQRSLRCVNWQSDNAQMLSCHLVWLGKVGPK